MKYLSMFATVALLMGCQSSHLTPENSDASISADDTISSGINGVYSGGGSYNPYANGSNYRSGYNSSAANSDHYNNPNYGQHVVGGPKAQAKDRIIYFNYDSSAIDSRAAAIVQQHANYLKKHASTKIILAGHTDSRGSREYNISLGERRAASVKRRFQALGISPAQIRIVSYGEESPAVNGYNENAYKRNRRVVIQY